MGILSDYINKAFDISRQKAVSGGTLAKRNATSQARRSASSMGISGVLKSALENRGQREVTRGIQNRMKDLEIARNTALAGANQFDLNRGDRNRQFDLTRSDRNAQFEENKNLQRDIANQQLWSNIWGGVGSLANAVTGGNLLKNLIGGGDYQTNAINDAYSNYVGQ